MILDFKKNKNICAIQEAIIYLNHTHSEQISI